jgi:hypothetical protein
MKALDNSAIAALLAPSQPTHVSTQKGPLRFIDTELRCASRGCSSPTYIKVNNISRCYMHALTELNDMLVGQTSTFVDEGGIGLDDLPGTL